jgi:Protein of unknown function (DUF1203)
MRKLKIVAMASETVEQVRKTMKAPGYGFPAHREVTAGRAPCRHCLKLIRPQEEELILFTYDAFQGQGVPPMPGPVYVHASSCERYSDTGEIPEEYRGQPLTLEAFAANRERLAEQRTTGSSEATVLEELFERSETKYVHVRSTSAGCYLFRVERA